MCMQKVALDIENPNSLNKVDHQTLTSVTAPRCVTIVLVVHNNTLVQFGEIWHQLTASQSQKKV